MQWEIIGQLEFTEGRGGDNGRPGVRGGGGGGTGEWDFQRTVLCSSIMRQSFHFLCVCVCILYLFVKIAAFLFALETNGEEYQFTRQTIYDWKTAQEALTKMILPFIIYNKPEFLQWIYNAIHRVCARAERMVCFRIWPQLAVKCCFHSRFDEASSGP